MFAPGSARVRGRTSAETACERGGGCNQRLIWVVRNWLCGCFENECHHKCPSIVSLRDHWLTRSCLLTVRLHPVVWRVIFHGTGDTNDIKSGSPKHNIITYLYKGQWTTFACEQCWLLLLKEKEDKREDFFFFLNTWVLNGHFCWLVRVTVGEAF